MNSRKLSHSVLPVLASGALLLALTAAWAEDKKGETSKAPPKGAVVLFDGKDLSGWTARGDKPAGWKIEDGYMEVKGGDILTKEKFGPDFRLHVEFCCR